MANRPHGGSFAGLVGGLLLMLAANLAWADILYVHTDHLNTPRLATDEQGTVVWRNLPTTEPFGNSPVEEDPDGDSILTTLNLRFPGQYYDRETSTHYNYFRDCYDPLTGRYCQPDPLGLYGGDLSLYLYGRNNPLSHIDPMGLTPLAGAAGASGGATGGFGGLGGFGTNSGGRNRGDDGSFGGLFPPGTFPGNSPNTMSSWEVDLDFADNGPKTEWQPWRCKTDEDRDCRDRRIGLQILYTKIKILGLLGANTAAAKSSYNSMVRAYHRDCPNWGKLPLMQ